MDCVVALTGFSFEYSLVISPVDDFISIAPSLQKHGYIPICEVSITYWIAIRAQSRDTKRGTARLRTAAALIRTVRARLLSMDRRDQCICSFLGQQNRIQPIDQNDCVCWETFVSARLYMPEDEPKSRRKSSRSSTQAKKASGKRGQGRV